MLPHLLPGNRTKAPIAATPVYIGADVPADAARPFAAYAANFY